MIYLLLYLTTGAIVAVYLSDVLSKHTDSRFEYLLALGITIAAWPFIILNAFAIIYTHWGDSE